MANLLGVRKHSSAEDTSKTVEDVIYRDAFDNVDLIPSHLDLFTIDLDLAGITMRETLLRRSISSALGGYRIVVCDCPPNLTVPTQNALAVSTHFVTPVSLDFLSVLGVGLLHNRIQILSDAMERQLVNAGIVIGRVGRPSSHRLETQAAIRERFGDLVLSKEIRELSSISESAEKHKSVFDMGNRDAKGDFEEVCSQLLERLGVS